MTAHHTFIEGLEDELPAWALNDFEDEATGGGFVGVLGLIANVACHVWTFCNHGALLKAKYVAEDVLPKFAWERGMPQYVGESSRQHADRMADCWEAYAVPGREAIISQLRLYGFASAAIFTAADWPTEPPVGPVSQFWVVVPYGYHPFDVPEWGTMVWGEFTWGISGATVAQIEGIRALVKKWKPVQWVAREVRFMLSHGGYYAVVKVAGT